MANWFDPRDDQESGWKQWVEDRPESIRAVAEMLRPWRLYRLLSTNQIVTLYSISEPEAGATPTVSVNIVGYVDGVLPMPTFGVFGINPADLEEYEPGSADELMALARRAAGE